MEKSQKGLMLIGIAVGINLLGRGVIAAMGPSQDLTGASVMLAVMFVSVVLGLFGLFRLIVGLIQKD